MVQHFLLTSATRTLTLKDVYHLTNEQAFKLFRPPAVQTQAVPPSAPSAVVRLLYTCLPSAVQLQGLWLSVLTHAGGHLDLAQAATPELLGCHHYLIELIGVYRLYRYPLVPGYSTKWPSLCP